MNITIFNKEYTIRRFGEQKDVKGYLTSSYSDEVVSLHIHPASSDTLRMLPEGERFSKVLEGHGTYPLRASNKDSNTKGDLLYYKGDWYECTSSVEYDHTVLSHYNYQFVILPKDVANSTDALSAPAVTSDDEEVNE